MALEIIIPVAVLAIGAGVKLISHLISTWGHKNVTPESLREQVELSQTDREKIDETRELIRDMFGDNVAEKFKNASNVERINMVNDFAHRLAKLYGLDDVDIDVVIDNVSLCGYYCHSQHQARFNILALTNGVDSPNYAALVKDMLDTVIHELRHAVQFKAVENDGFWNVDDKRRAAWASNVKNYISASTDMRGYMQQPLEADAYVFAGLVMEGVN